MLSTHVAALSPPEGQFSHVKFLTKTAIKQDLSERLEPSPEHWSLGTFQPFYLIIHTRPPPSQSIDTINLLTPSNINHYISGGTLTPLTPLPMQEMKPSMFSPIIADSTAPFNTGK